MGLREGNTLNRALRSLTASGASALLLFFGARCLTPRSQGQDGPVPGATDLLRGAALRSHYADRWHGPDRRTGQPAPLPVIDPSKDGKRGGRDRGPAISPEGNIFVDRKAKIEMPGSDRQVGPDGVASDEVRLHLLQGAANEVRDFKVKRLSIKKVEYFEDMLLAESDRRVAMHDYARAFEYCLRVQPQSRLARDRRPRESCAVRRRKQRLDRWRR